MESTTELSANGRKLLLRLLELPQGWQSAGAIAQAIGISRRTVMRELPPLELWLTAAGYSLLRNPGQGLLLDEDAARRGVLRELLSSQATTAYGREERRYALLALLLAADTPIKSYALAQELAVGEHLLTADLGWAESWLEPYGAKLHRRPGVGVWVETGPAVWRRAAGALLRSITNGQAEKWNHLAPPFDALIDTEIAQKAYRTLVDFARAEHLHWTDASLVSLAIHCTLTVMQLKAATWENDAAASSSNAARGCARRLARALESAFAVHIPEEELAVLSFYLAGFGVPIDPQDVLDADSLETHRAATRLIQLLAQEMTLDFSAAPSLAEDLTRHLRTMLMRIANGTVSDNPMLATLQAGYPALWRATRSACDAFSKELSLPAIPDSEAGYLALHFGAVLEQDAAAQLRLRAIALCPSGMAAGRFLAGQLAREFPQLGVQVICSVGELAPLLRGGADFVISTVPLTADVPVVVVNAILRAEDRERLDATVRTLLAAPRRRPAKNTPALRHTGAVANTLLELIDTLRIETVPVPRTRAALILAAARLFCSDAANAGQLERAFFRREKLGETYIRPLNAVLLHCRTPVVPGCRFGYLRAEPPVYEEGKTIAGALVMLAPETGDAPLAIMQSVSGLLIEQPALMDALRRADHARAAALLEQGLNELFQATKL